MTPEQDKPWWELPPKLPTEPEFEPERERLRAELARAWRARLHERELRLMRPRVYPPTPFTPPNAA